MIAFLSEWYKKLYCNAERQQSRIKEEIPFTEGKEISQVIKKFEKEDASTMDYFKVPEMKEFGIQTSRHGLKTKKYVHIGNSVD